MALRFHARRKIPQRFFPPSHIHPARCRAKAALLNSPSTPSKELTSHVIVIVSRALTQARQNVNLKFLRSNFRRVPILDPRAYDPSGLRQESRALGATIMKEQRK